MSKRIICKDCGIYLGEIRDATLKKGILFQCKSCKENDAVKKFKENQSAANNLFSEGPFADIFGGGFGKK